MSQQKLYLYLAVSFKIETGLYELFTSDSYLYCLFDWGVIDEDKVTAAAGSCNLVTLYFILVFIDGSLNMWRYHIGDATGWFGGLGEKTIQLIVDHIFALGWDVKGWSIDDLCTISGIATKSAVQFNDGWWRYQKDAYFGQMPVKVEYWATPKREIKDDKLLGMKVCMTGFRDENLKGQIEEKGGKVTDNVSKDTTCLLCKDKSSNSGKVKKAQQLGIEILTRQEFIEKHLND